jgi:hypothetical protein
MEMNARTVFLAGLTVALCASTAYAKDCEIRQSNLDVFARYRLGHLKAIPGGVKRLANCAVDLKYHSFDCEFVDADGTHYTTADDEIAKLERGPERSSALPPSYPLKFGMPFEDARRILSAMDPKIEFTDSHSDDGYGIETGECLKDSHGVTYYFVVDFDKAGRLNKLTAAFVTAED